LELLILLEVAEAKGHPATLDLVDSAPRRQSSAAAELLMHLPNLEEALDRPRSLVLRGAVRAAQHPDQTWADRP
jgi:hypothetical protein